MIEPPEQTSTGKLLQRALGGDQESAWRIFTRHRAFLVREASKHRLMRVVRHNSTPEDIVSEVWVRAYTSGALHSFDDRGHGSLQRLLCTLLHRALVDAVRRMKTSKRRAAEAEGPVEPCRTVLAGPSQDPSPTSNARAAELRELCLLLLDGTERKVWQLSEEGGLRSVAIARELCTTPAAVRGILHRARRKLIVHLAGDRRAADERHRGAPSA